MTSTQKRGKDEGQSTWGLIIVVIGFVLVVSSAISFGIGIADDDANWFLKAIYQVLLGMGAIAYGESQTRSSSEEN